MFCYPWLNFSILKSFGFLPDTHRDPRRTFCFYCQKTIQIGQGWSSHHPCRFSRDLGTSRHGFHENLTFRLICNEKQWRRVELESRRSRSPASRDPQMVWAVWMGAQWSCWSEYTGGMLGLFVFRFILAKTFEKSSWNRFLLIETTCLFVIWLTFLSKIYWMKEPV